MGPRSLSERLCGFAGTAQGLLSSKIGKGLPAPYYQAKAKAITVRDYRVLFL